MGSSWSGDGEEAERVRLEIDHLSLPLRRGQLMRTSSWEAATAVEEEEEVQEMGCQVDLGQEGGLAEEAEGYQVAPEECDNMQRQRHSVELWKSDLVSKGWFLHGEEF